MVHALALLATMELLARRLSEHVPQATTAQPTESVRMVCADATQDSVELIAVKPATLEALEMLVAMLTETTEFA